MKLNVIPLAVTCGLSLALAACGDSNTPQPAATETATPPAQLTDFDPLSRTYTLTPSQQELRDKYDMAAFESEYAGYRDAIVAKATPPATEAKDEAGTSPAPAATDDKTDSGIRSRSDMTWDYLDRNGDGKLSVAEYAVWAIPTNPNNPAPNDEKKPYLTSDEANGVADSFFYYDRDGDTYLSPQEFSAARLGRTFGPAE